MPGAPAAMLLVLVTGVALAAGQAPPLSPIRTSADGSIHFFDAHGRVRIFHGAARVQKGPPWYFADLGLPGSKNDTEAAAMESLGFNVLRLGFMWSGYNPAPGVFNQTYIEVVKHQVAQLNARGVYVLLDMHQDIISSAFCLYDGAPRWVIDKSIADLPAAHGYPAPLEAPAPKDNNCILSGSPHSPCNCSRDATSWSENALTYGACNAYQSIYDNRHGMLDDMATFWARAAVEFKDTPGIIGYELMNEPFAGDIFSKPELVLPGVAGKQNLQKMHDAVAEKIREVDQQHIIFFEPVTWGMIGAGKVTGSGFEHVPGGDAWKNASAYAYHYYCMSWLPGWETQPIQRKLLCDAAIAPAVFEAVGEDIRRIGGAQMMTEGMACNQDNMTQQEECIKVQEDLDKHLFSWTDYGDSQGSLWDVHPLQQKVWARTYARAIAGTPLNMTFDVETAAFEFCFTMDRQIQAPTEIFASNVYHYGAAGPKVTHSKNLQVSKGQTEGLYLAEPVAEGAPGIGCVHMAKH